MPKKVFDSVLRLVERDIAAGYNVGDAYLTLHTIAEKFDIGYGTAVKVVNKLSELNIVDTVRGSGITVKSLEPRRRLEGRKIAVLTKNPVDDWFPDAFYQGARDFAVKEGIEVFKARTEDDDLNSIKFGDSISAIDADGVITLGFSDSPLAFYHSMVKQVDLVADIPFSELPMLPVVATDNFRHGQEAARRFHLTGHTEVCVVTCSPATEQNCRGFMLKRLEGFLSVAKEVGMFVEFIHLNTTDAEEKINRFFFRFNERKAAFSLELCANWHVASQFVQKKIPVRNCNVMMYDSTDEYYRYEGLPPIPTVGPSLKKLGAGLAQKLIDKWKTGSFAEPLCSLV